MSICAYCGQTGHVAASCPRRGEEPTQRRLNAEAEFRSVRRPAMTVVRKRRKPKIDPERMAAWIEDLEAINRELAQ